MAEFNFKKSLKALKFRIKESTVVDYHRFKSIIWKAVLCEIMGLENQEYISSSRDSKGRIVSRPLEDQAPFLDRDLFLSEMIVEP